jgi:hypothetical protein
MSEDSIPGFFPKAGESPLTTFPEIDAETF